jgi:hypothetical protein
MSRLIVTVSRVENPVQSKGDLTAIKTKTPRIVTDSVRRMSNWAVWTAAIKGEKEGVSAGELRGDVKTTRRRRRKERKTHWTYVKKSGRPGVCAKCGRRGYLSAVRTFDGRMVERCSHVKWWGLLGRHVGTTHFAPWKGGVRWH